MIIVFHDVDGCLNADAESPIPRIGETMSHHQAGRLRELGKRIDSSSVDQLVINTGRSLEDTLHIVGAISSRKMQYVVCEHGAVYHNIQYNTPLDIQGDVADKLRMIKDFIGWYREIGAPMLNQRLGMDIPMLNKVANLTLDVRNGMDTRLVHDELRDLVMRDSPFDHTLLIFHHSRTDGYVDVMSQIDKGDGIAVVISLLTTDESQHDSVRSIAIGNGINDIPMLKAAKIAVCPQNAEPEVQAYCQAHPGVVSEHEYIDATLQWLEAFQ